MQSCNRIIIHGFIFNANGVQKKFKLPWSTKKLKDDNKDSVGKADHAMPGQAGGKEWQY
jgi:hypothetical protein